MDRGVQVFELDGEPMCVIESFDSMPPFLMTLASESDLWMYLSSTGAVTAGRRDPDHALFPYTTDDELHRLAGQTGPITVLRVTDRTGAVTLWEPFKDFPSPQRHQRNLYKSVHSDRIAFEETHASLGLTFRATWAPIDRFGFVRTVTLVADKHSGPYTIDVLDGLLNVLPSGPPYDVTRRLGCLVDAYQQSEIDAETGVGIFCLATTLNDGPDPGEVFHASTAWSRGLPNPAYLLTADATPAFRRGERIRGDQRTTGRRGGFLVVSTLELAAGGRATWDIVADTNQTQADVEALRLFLRTSPDPRSVLRDSLKASGEALAANVASSDGHQVTADAGACLHLASCALFNNMRGGVFSRNYEATKADFVRFVGVRNKSVAKARAAFLEALPENITYKDLLAEAESVSDGDDLVRLVLEYLPLTFSRRHGDPSRPWNRFEIQLRNPDGSPKLGYQGNWRDIFQNWEALGHSFPGFVESFIAKFVNASTVDGFNPYRLTQDGIDWEVPEPDDPWAGYGYWGDHQIVYLTKLLEASEQYHPALLDKWLDRPIFTYADVPYRISSYDEMLTESRRTISFDAERHAAKLALVSEKGTDGRLVESRNGEVLHVTFAEKLLTPILSKLSNFVMDGGIWMNTQRPEWNDANNALVGNGLSMVTLCYLRRHLEFCLKLFRRNDGLEVPMSTEVLTWLRDVHNVFGAHTEWLAAPRVDDRQRRKLLDMLGKAVSRYRDQVYEKGFSGTLQVALSEIVELFEVAIRYLDHSIRANRRDDGLYHAYNLLALPNAHEARVDRLYEMLEGQVAVLSSGVLEPGECASLVDALFESRMFRPDQKTFILYPKRTLPDFLAKNLLSEDTLDRVTLLRDTLNAGCTALVIRDPAGNLRFAPTLTSARIVEEALTHLRDDPEWRAAVDRDRQKVLDLYEETFDHRSFTGRSGGMYAFEGIGSVYWHMVSKLMLAVHDEYWRAKAQGASEQDQLSLAKAFYRVRSGMGFNKTAKEFGAFPPDPYSHTPGHAGARQPGMTGQTKEDILARRGELGIIVRRGSLSFEPWLTRRCEFLAEPMQWAFHGPLGNAMSIELPAGSLGFTVCGTPVVYRLSDGDLTATVTLKGGAKHEFAEARLDPQTSAEVFNRTGGVSLIEVAAPVRMLQTL